MTFTLLGADIVEALHDSVLNPGELPGRARDKSLEGALARVDNRLIYGLIGDIFDLAAAYATAIATGHCFNDGNKRTAFDAMNFCLELNGVELNWQVEDAGDRIIALAHGLIGEEAIAEWLRNKARG
ncbi:type II toxin-antitoxin system death-on-curing family toxin [Pseudooceanicola lipolyticus]|uniref:Type II toxin-antitoxin system death-on-curing family toxin n=1 Tax=Pseudooceanicola lipolyticus TaxID=2029104 RepID=A0A2M8IUW5_9RHOB|nr:type II toxin-antitoxin system death-on-curing family toxin [Pseudooceanicola lipolyticus]PJE34312.1 type II toxin-antitoxin system death-on-curing family toxin [Pseudooceanicola lipolyticus]